MRAIGPVVYGGHHQFYAAYILISLSELAAEIEIIYQPTTCCRKNPVNENRIATRRRVLKAAFIVASDKAPKLECSVRNLSETGAALQVSTTIGIPKSVDVVIDGTRRHCRTVWRTDTN